MGLLEIIDIQSGGLASLKEQYESTAEIGELLPGYDGPVCVWNLDAMPEDFAEKIVKHNGNSLEFNHVNAAGPALSIRAAQIQARYRGKLVINDIDRLDFGRTGGEVEIARALAGHEGELYLNWLTEISTGGAIELFRHKAPVFVDNLDGLSPEALLALQGAEKRWLHSF